MKFLVDIFTNHALLCACIAWFVAQTSKIVVNAIKEKKFSLAILFSDGGMPSGHSATVIALACGAGFAEGLGSTVFAVAAILALVVLNDATGVRLEAEKHAAAIKELAEKANKNLPEGEKIVETEHLKRRVGHTLAEVLAGTAVGIIVAVVYALIFIW